MGSILTQFNQCSILQNMNDQTLEVVNSDVFLTFGEQSRDRKRLVASIYNPDSAKGSTISHLAFRKYTSIVSVGNGETMIVGGKAFGSKYSKSVELFSCKQGLIRSVAPLHFARQGHCGCAIDGTVFVCGGYDGETFLRSSEVYSRKMNQWLILPDIEETRYNAALVSLPDRSILVIGGYNECWDELSSVEVCRLPPDFESTKLRKKKFWGEFPPMRMNRSGHSASVFQNNIFVVGGAKYDDENYFSVEMFNISMVDGQWIILSEETRESRYLFSLVVTHEGLFAFGNRNYPANTVECLRLRKRRNSNQNPSRSSSFDISSAEWESLPDVSQMNNIKGSVLIPNSCFRKINNF